MKNKFREFLINEDKSFLGQKVNDILTSMQDLEQDMPNIGSRHLNRLASELSNSIRKIIGGQWKPAQHRYLKELQKIGVAIEKTIDEKGDLKELLPAATQAVQDLASQLGVRVHGLEAPEIPGQSVQPQDFQITGQDPEIPQVPQARPEGAPPMPPGAPPMPPGAPPMPPMG